MSKVKIQYVIPVHFRIARCHHRVEESLFLEVEKPTMGSLQLMRRGSASHHRPSSYVDCGMKMTPLSLGNIILLKEKGGMRESIPRQVDKKSRVPKEEKGVWGSQSGDRGLEFSRRRKGQTSFFFFLSTFLSLSYIKNFFFFKHRTDDYTTNNSV